MENGLTLVALLYVNEGREKEFERFETAAAEIMRDYGGRLERRIVFGARADGDQPDEIHLVNFPDERAFERYRADQRLREMAQLRATAIRRTAFWFGADRVPFGSERAVGGKG